MSGRSRRPGNDPRALPWRTAVLAGLIVCLVPWELDTPKQAHAGTVAVEGTGADEGPPAQAEADLALQSSDSAATGSRPTAAPSGPPAEVLGAGPNAPAVIEASPASFSDPTH